jgi:prepilin-type N-terminal cleavage/methylation domain-containing protein
MKLISKVKGYTLLELSVGLMLSAIVIAYALSTGLFFKARFSAAAAEHFKTIDFIRFNSDLDRNMFESEEVLFEDSILVFKYLRKETVRYFFSDTIIIRRNISSIDTFHIQIARLDVEYKPQTNLVTTIELTLMVHTPKSFLYQKDYPIAVCIHNQKVKQ